MWHAVTGADFQSYVMRPRLYQQLLRQKGDSLYILELQGYIFFGTADRLVEQIRARIETPDFAEIKYLVLDFRLVTGVDSSATFSFTKLMQLIQNRKIVLAFTNLAPAIRSLWEKEIFINANPAYLKLFPDLDQGVSWCEDQMIEVFTSVGLVAKPKTLFQLLEAALPKPKTETDLMDLLLPKKKSASPNRQQTRLLKYFEQIETQVGQTIVAEGAEIQGLYFVEKGQVIAQKQTAILRIMQAGTAFGETDFYAAEQKAAADYVVSQPGILFYLSSDQLQAMEADDLILSNAFHRLIAENLSKKLIQTNDTILALQR